MDLIGIDFETKSEVDLMKHGAARYFAGKKADLVFLSYKINKEKTRQWHPGDPLLDFMVNPGKYHFYAFNALFEFRAWNLLGVTMYNYQPISLGYMTDVQAICGRFTYFQKLEKAGEVLNLKVQKDKRGKALIKKICTPPFEYTHQDFFEFMQYGLDDVRTMHEMLYALPATKLSQKEQQIWELTQKINLRGVPIDIKAVHQIIKVTDAYKKEQNFLLPELTGGNVTRATQGARILHFVRNKGVHMANMQAKTVEDTLARLDLPEDVRLVLELRQELGKSSTAKYAKLDELHHDGRVHDNLRYYGANTGRWAGMGFQIHNLPRSKVKDAQPIIDSFFDLTVVEDNPVQKAKEIVRGMICAPPGKMIMMADYKSIENRALAWFADDYETLELFRQGLDQYIDMATARYSKAYEDITDAERQFGKMLILGCGYGLGGPGFQKNAAGWGVYIDLFEAKEAVTQYRDKYYKIVKLWYRCKQAAINAIVHPNTEFKVHLVSYKVIKDKNGIIWLQCMLPSGRAIYYNDPQIVDGPYGPEVSAMGINPYSKKWQRLRIIPGRFVENIVQAFCRDILAEGKLNADHAGYALIGSVHDEPIAEVDESYTDIDKYCKIICDMPAWADGLPLEAEGVIEKRYRKM